MRIPNTLHLEYVYVSEALLPEVAALPGVEVMGELHDFEFDEHGYLPKMHHM
jgi:hypothetical protein